MKTYVVTENNRQIALLRPFLQAARIKDVHLVASGRRSSASSLAGSIVLARQSPVAVVLDSYTTDEATANEQQLTFEYLVRPTTLLAPCRLFLAMPTLEEQMFPDAASFERISGVALAPQDATDFARVRQSLLTKSIDDAGNADAARLRITGLDYAAARDGFGNALLKALFAFLKHPKPVKLAA